MSITKISDLKVGQEYYVCFVPDGRYADKCELIAIINENKQYQDIHKTELYLRFKTRTNLVYCQEIGIGTTKIEARKNYGKFSYEAHPSFSNSLDDVKK